MGGIVLQKNGSRLEFIVDKETNKRVLYDFKDNSFTSYTGRNVKLSTVKAMFSKFGCNINKEESDPMYTKLLEMMTNHWGYSIYNLGSKLEKLDKYKYTEKWMVQGFVVDMCVNERFDSLLSNVNKAVRKVYLNNNVRIDGMGAFANNDKIGVFLEEMSNRYDSDEMRNILSFHRISRFAEDIKTLLSEYKYSPKSLANYICNIKDYEALTVYDTAIFLLDFITMNKQMGVSKPEKYPRHLHTTHDIVVRNFNAFKIEHSEELFANLRREDYNYKGKDYSIIYPSHYKEIQKEGAELNHCVASYVENVMAGKTHIVFLRKTDSLKDSLVTVEIRNETIVQYRGSYNRSLSQEELNFLKIYSEKKKLKLN